MQNSENAKVVGINLNFFLRNQEQIPSHITFSFWKESKTQKKTLQENIFFSRFYLYLKGLKKDRM